MEFRELVRLYHRALRFLLKTEKHEIKLVRDILQSGDFALDIGAHKAGFTFWMHRRVQESGKVLAFEPIPALADYMREVANHLNGCYRTIEVHQLGLSNRSGQANLYFPGEHFGCASLEKQQSLLQDPITISTIPLDTFFEEYPLGDRRISFIKCDVERHELAVFEGAMETFRSHKPILLFETGNLLVEDEDRIAVFSLLERLGYHGFWFAGSRLCEIDNWHGKESFIDPEAYQNFLFVHPENAEMARRIRRHLPKNARWLATADQLAVA